MRYIFLGLVLVTFFASHAQLSVSQQRTDARYAKATELATQANAAAARIAFLEFLNAASPSDVRRVEAEYQLVRAALLVGSKDAEGSALQFVEANAGAPRSHQARFDLANYFYLGAKYSKAVEQYSKVDFTLLSAEDQVQGKFQWAYSYFSERNLTDALLYFNQIKGVEHPYTAAANYYAGFIEFSNQQYAEALRDLQKAEASQAYAAITPYLIASIYYRQSQYDLLLQYADKVKDREPIKNKKELLLLTAEALYAKSDYAAAATVYSECLTDKLLGDAGVWYRAGVSNDKVGRSTEAVRFLELSAATDQDVSYAASYQLAIVYLQKGDKAYALNAFDRARKTKEVALAEQAQFNYAKVLYDLAQPDKAITEFEYYLRVYPQGSFVNSTRELLAQAYVNGNNYNKALEYIEALAIKTVAVEQAYQKAAFLKGAEHFNKNEYAEAVLFFTKSLTCPRDGKYTQRSAFWCAEAFSIQKKYVEAEAHYQQAIKIQADPVVLAQAYFGVGYALYNQKAFDKARVNFQQFVSRTNRETPNYADGVLRLADCHYMNKSFDEALVFYNQYKQYNTPDVDYAYLQSGLLYGLQRKYQESRNQLTLLVNNFPSSTYRAEALYQRAQFDIEQGLYSGAIDGLTQLITSAPTSAYLPYAYARRAASYFNTKEIAKTIDDYLLLIKLYPAHPLAQEALSPLQEALELQGRSAEFDQHLAAVKAANPDAKGLENIEFETAKKLYFSEQYEKAITSLQSFVSLYTQSVFVSEANYYTAESYYRLRKLEQALPFYAQLKTVTSFAFAGRVAGRLAEISFKLARYEEAIQHYHFFERYATSKKDLYTTLNGLMESFYFIAQYDSTDFYAGQILERAAINAGAENKASLFLGKTAMARGDYEAAEDEFLSTLNAARDEYGAEAKYQLATLFFLRKEYKQCHETLLGLNRDFKAYEFWVGKSFLLLAENYRLQQNVFQATATLQSLVDNFPLAVIRDEAAVKLKEMQKQEAIIPSDTTENK
jgi:tetratricopeptide (TPR) repeat protein